MVDQGNSDKENTERCRSEGLDQGQTIETPDDIDLAAEILMENIIDEPVPDRIDRLARQLSRELKERDGGGIDRSLGDPLD